MNSNSITTLPRNTSMSNTFDTVASLLHDLLSPILMIEMHSELLKQHLPILLDVTNQNHLSELQATPQKLNQFAQRNRQKIDYVWQRLHSLENKICSPLFLIELASDFLYSWQAFERQQRKPLTENLTSVLDLYQKYIVSTPNMPKINDDHWMRLNKIESENLRTTNVVIQRLALNVDVII